MGAISYFKYYQSRTEIIQSEKGDLLTDCRSILAGWRNNSFPLLNDVRQTETHKSQPLMPRAMELGV
jgi:hypothetical protein